MTAADRTLPIVRVNSLHPWADDDPDIVVENDYLAFVYENGVCVARIEAG